VDLEEAVLVHSSIPSTENSNRQNESVMETPPDTHTNSLSLSLSTHTRTNSLSLLTGTPTCCIIGALSDRQHTDGDYTGHQHHPGESRHSHALAVPIERIRSNGYDITDKING
jgi:hypothetical protein